MKVINVGDIAYQVLRVYPYESTYNIEVYKKTAQYDKLIKSDNQQLMYFCDVIQDAEFTEIDPPKLKALTKKKTTKKPKTGTKRPTTRKPRKKKV